MTASVRRTRLQLCLLVHRNTADHSNDFDGSTCRTAGAPPRAL